ncbi:hypothetical protein ACG3SL_17585 [Sphingomonas sp. CJ20]
MYALALGLAAIAPMIGPGKRPQFSAMSATTVPALCQTGDPDDDIEIRQVRPAETPRVALKAGDIVQRGEGYRVKRSSPIWKRFAEKICGQTGNVASSVESLTDPRIVIFLRNDISGAAVIEFPREDFGYLNVKYYFEGSTGFIAARDIRRLLDYAVRVE